MDPVECKDGFLFVEENTLSDVGLFNAWSRFGNIKSCAILMDPDGVSKRVGCIYYKKPADANAAFEHARRMVRRSQIRPAPGSMCGDRAFLNKYGVVRGDYMAPFPPLEVLRTAGKIQMIGTGFSGAVYLVRSPRTI
jgi:hypothetical protein